nr:MAG TPA: hypothetical protein [Caudoviricetes sp.]
MIHHVVLSLQYNIERRETYVNDRGQPIQSLDSV